MSTVPGSALVVAVLLAAAGPAPVSSQASGPARTEAVATPLPSLGLVDAVRSALAISPEVGSARARVAGSAADLSEARSGRWPSLAATASIQQFQEPMVVTPIHGLAPGDTPPFDETLIQGGASLTYTLFDGGSRKARTRVAREGLTGTRVAATAAAQDVVLETATAFLEVRSARDLVEAHLLRLEALRAELDRVTGMRDEGQVAPVDVLRVEAAVGRGEADLVEVHARLGVAEATLARLVGLPRDSVVRRGLDAVVAPEGSPPPRSRALAEALAHNPAVLGAHRKAAATEGRVRMAASARWPRLETGVQFVNRGGLDSDFTGEWSAGLQVSVPLFTGGAASSRVQRAEADYRGALEDVRAAERRVEEAVDEALAALTGAMARVESLESVVEMAEEVARVERLRVETGATTETDYLQAEADLLDARAALVRARTGEVGGWVGLARARGLLSVEWLERGLGR